MKIWLYKLLFIVICLFAFDTYARDTVYIAPHQGQYLVKLHKINNNVARIVDANGTLTYRLVQDCTGWLATTSIYIDVVYEDGMSRSIISNLSSFESFDGWSYSFAFENYNEEGKESIYTGNVDFPINKSSAVLNFNLPKKQNPIQLPITTLFPVGFYKNIIKSANDGVNFFNALHYDGSAPTELFNTSVFITSLMQGQETYNISGDTDLIANQPLIKTSIAFFGKTNKETPEFESNIEMFNNGIMKKMIQNLGPIDVEVVLQELENITSLPCNN